MGEDRLTLGERIDAGFASVREIVGKVWPYILAGIAIGAGIHGYVPQDFMASFMGKDAWWAVPLAVLIGVPMYTNAAGVIPIVQALLAKGAALGTVLAFMMSVIALSLPGDGDPAQGAQDAPDRHLRRRGRHRHPDRGLRVQRRSLINSTGVSAHERNQGTRHRLLPTARTTIALIEQVAQAKGVAVNLQKVEDLRDIMSYGVMSTPGVVIDGKVVHAGGVPSRDKIEQWLAAA